MRLKRNIIIAAVCIALCIVALIVTLNIPDISVNDTPKTENTSTAVVLVDYKINSFVNEKIIVESENPFTLVKTIKDNGEVQYVVDSHKGIEFVNSSINNIANNFSYVQMADTIEKNASDLEKYGLLNPQGKYTLVNDNGKTTTVLIGDKIGNMYYSMLVGDKNVYTIYEAYGRAVLSGVNLYRNTDVIATGGEDFIETLKSFVVNKKGSKALNIRLITDEDKITSATSKFIMTSPYSMPVYSKKFLEALNTFLPLKIEEFVEDNPVSLAGYGLNNPECSITVETAEGIKTIRFGNAEGNSVYSMIEGENYVFLLPKSKVDAIVKIDPYIICDRYAHLINITDVTSVQIKSSDGLYNYNLEIDRSKEHYFYLNGKPAEEASFRTAYRYITGMALSSDAGGKAQKVNEAIRIVFNFIDGSSYKAVYYEYDDRNYVLDQNGEASNFLVAKKSIEQMCSKIEDIVIIE